ncbi:YbjQ family protein [Shouchella lonarensis]|uniref:UPF0145 protein SAMN05421737_101323 n=1 Tax=Shouchella lonarensis TaxID=1464122 RepID=A0A1G6GPE0_9BACI|nr:heavy metal-binding domain-containing protein [Shouchella lonarensis]SDB83804.1 Uncharacterized conserved protein YbjQ, UPF0145 family [Shouchella lonarensis]
MIIVTTDSVPNQQIKELKGYVKGNTVQAKHVGRDILAGLKGIVGGEIKDYSDMMTEARQIAVGRMVEDAKKKGANAIVAFRLDTSSVMGGASEIIAYGTAVVVE